MNAICTYGLYRKGEVGYDFLQNSYGKNSILYKRTVDIAGYRMYDAIFSPTIEFTGNLKDKIVVDLMMVDDTVYNYMKRVEVNQNFFEHLLNIDFEFYSIFVEWPIKEDYKEVEYGDWSKFLKNN